MSYILRNITRGDLSLTNTLHIKHNGYAKVDEVTEMMRNEERKGIICISPDVLEELTESVVEPTVETPIPSIEVPEVEVPEVEVESVVDSIEDEEPKLVEPIEEIEEKTEVANSSPKSFNYNRNDHKNKFKK